jgi:hypothetical protein
MPTNRALRILALFLSGLLFTLAATFVQAQTNTFQEGDVFAAVGEGQVKWYRSDGTLVQVLDTGQGGFTTGMAFDDDGHLYVTNFDANVVSVFDTNGDLIGTFGSNYGDNPESIVFDEEGNMYVGHAGPGGGIVADRSIKKYDPSGTLLAEFEVECEDRGSDWIELASDQCTMFYTSEGTLVKRFDVCTNTQLPDFASGLSGRLYALRLLEDGSLLVAGQQNIQHLDSTGAIIGTYDVLGEDHWFALNRDPDGESFWSGDQGSGSFYKIDIDSGEVLIGPINACTTDSCLGGLAVFGELTVVSATPTPSPSPGSMPTSTPGSASNPTPTPAIGIVVSPPVVPPVPSSWCPLGTIGPPGSWLNWCIVILVLLLLLLLGFLLWYLFGRGEASGPVSAPGRRTGGTRRPPPKKKPARKRSGEDITHGRPPKPPKRK